MAAPFSQKNEIQKAKPLHQSSPGIFLLFGGFSGLVSRSMVAPFERLIILAQTKDASAYGLQARRSVSQTILTIYKQEGIRGLFQSNGVNCLRIVPQTSIEFFIFDHAKGWAKSLCEMSGVAVPDQIRNLVAGSFAGMIAFAAVYPLDVIKTMVAVNSPQKSMREAMKLVVGEKQSFLKLYTGLRVCLLGIFPYCGFKLGFFQSFKDSYCRFSEGPATPLANFFLGGLAAMGAVTLTYPMDLLRRRIQIELILHGRSLSYFGLMKEIKKESGLSGLFHGLRPTYMKIIPALAFNFMIMEFLKESYPKYVTDK